MPAASCTSAGRSRAVNGSVPRNRLAAVDVATGGVDAAFDPNVNDRVSGLAVLGGTLYAGGQFTTVNGTIARPALAGFDAQTGVLDTTFTPATSGTNNIVNALLAAGSQLYAGGQFLAVGPDPQLRFAQFTQPAVAPAVVSGAAAAIAIPARRSPAPWIRTASRRRTCSSTARPPRSARSPHP